MPQNISADLIPSLTLNVVPEQLIQKGKKVAATVLGFPTKYDDEISTLLTFPDPAQKVEPRSQAAREEAELRGAAADGATASAVTWKLRVEYSLQQITEEFHNVGDIVSALGGIGASANLALGAIGSIWIIKFVLDLSAMLKRQFRHQLNMAILDIYKTKIPELREKLDARFENMTSEDNELLDDLVFIDNAATMKIKSYAQATESLLTFERLIKQYSSFNDLFSDDQDPDQVMLKLHQKRSAMSVTDIARLVAHRISIHGIFMLNEQQQQTNLILTSRRTQVLKEQESKKRLRKKHLDIDRKIKALKAAINAFETKRLV